MIQIRVAAYTKGKETPSARFRVRQLIPFLAEHSIRVQEYPGLFSRYPANSKLLTSMMGVSSLVARVPDIIAGYRCDLSLLQREMISTLTTLEPLLKRPIVMDVDDAIFLRRNGKAADRLASLSEIIICGNDFLAEHFSHSNQHVRIIPTGVDTHRYVPCDKLSAQGKKTIGWLGTQTNFKYLYQIAPALEKVMSLLPDSRLRIVADKRPDFSGKLAEYLDFIPWNYDRDVNEIQGMSVGIMPLANSDWERGKCSFKMLQYMACGIPVVVSPVGMNLQVLDMGQVGIAARTEKEWVDGMVQLLTDSNLAEEMGKNGREIVEDNFSIERVSTAVSEVLQEVVK